MLNVRQLSVWALGLGMMGGLVTVTHGADAPDGNPPPKQDGGPGGAGGPPGGGQGGGQGQRRGPGGFHLIPPFALEKLELTDDQKTQIADLEKETKAKLEKILTPEQMKTLKEARPPRGQGGRGGGGQGGPGGDAPGGGGQGGGGQGGGEGKVPPPPQN